MKEKLKVERRSRSLHRAGSQLDELQRRETETRLAWTKAWHEAADASEKEQRLQRKWRKALRKYEAARELATE